jgi:hypothetical protein
MISSPLTVTEAAPVVESTVQHAEPCTVRKHPANGHDPIGRRCREATRSPVPSRGCICRPA